MRRLGTCFFLFSLIAGVVVHAQHSRAESITWSQPQKLSTTQGATCVLNVAIERLDMPHIADIDIMADQIKKRKKPHLIMKIEALDALGEFSKNSHQLSENDLRSRQNPFTFSYSCTSQSRVLTVSICSDDDNTGQCQGKKPARMNSLVPNNEPLSDTSDAVYFFGVFVLRDGALGALPVLETSRYSVLKNALSSEVAVAPSEAQRIGSVVAKYNDAISSYPLILKDNMVVARLPRTVFNFQRGKLAFTPVAH